ncbi:hypothetical protein RUMOBE_01548 [Blautia obeum ATCC 29174]|uniref:Uncharacterized protein n=1 Tax=Blautia obeum ATCC 29174 TaxID=411459 RepID=A5ZRC1_9FIRM|nr:hypothetical protein RUMOBE_01548 [Blautia obeum ATCC 29174]
MERVKNIEKIFKCRKIKKPGNLHYSYSGNYSCWNIKFSIFIKK